MSPRMQALITYIVARAREASTYRDLIIVATAVGFTVTPDQGAAILGTGMIVGGLLGVLFPDRLGAPDTRATDPPAIERIEKENSDAKSTG